MNLTEFKQFKLVTATGDNYVIRIEGEVPTKEVYFVLPYTHGSWICTLKYDRANGYFITNFEGNLYLSLADKTICIMGAPANEDNTGEAAICDQMTTWLSLAALGAAIES